APAGRQEPAPPAGPQEAGPAAGPPGRNAEAAALTAEYVKRNYNYIQRRIRDRLVYPPPARRAGIQGVTEVSFTIHEDGRVSAVTVRAGSGHEVLDEAAVAVIFAAAPFPAPPAAARIAIPISFRLR
ncbi:MAG: TonB family protein, partial [Treponema sp.]|nr:TonB family protein [Treponema sp.]